MTTYQAIMLTAKGGPEVLQRMQLDVREPGRDEVRLRVRGDRLGVQVLQTFLQSLSVGLLVYTSPPIAASLRHTPSQGPGCSAGRATRVAHSFINRSGFGDS
jgi:hypothetical protein